MERREKCREKKGKDQENTKRRTHERQTKRSRRTQRKGSCEKVPIVGRKMTSANFVSRKENKQFPPSSRRMSKNENDSVLLHPPNEVIFDGTSFLSFENYF